jgi:TLP18.3/Psb32/MOLO-1 phosphatase superfamily protein
MYSDATKARYGWLLIGIVCLGVSAAGWAAWRLTHGAHRPRYLLINETGQHDYDLAFKMSLKIAEQKSGVENALILLAALPASKSIEETAANLFSQFRIGARTHGRGILYLYSARENLMKVEVSYALEGDIPDLYCRSAAEAAKTYMLSEIPQDFISELIITTNLRAMGASRDAVTWSRPEWLTGQFLSGGGGALVQGYDRTLSELHQSIQRLPERQLQQYLPAATAEGSVQRYLASLQAGIGDPRLPLLTEGSQIFRAVVPRNAEQQQRIWEYLHHAEPLRVLYVNDLALAVPQPNHSNLPIVLRRGNDGRWYVDEAKAWTYFHRFEDDVNFFVKYSDNPFLPGLRDLHLPHMEQTIYGSHVGTPALPSDTMSLALLIQSLEAKVRAEPNAAANYAALGDVYLFEVNWISKAIYYYRAASALAPAEPSYHWRLMDLYMNDSRADKMLAQLQYLSEHLAGDPQTQRWYRFYQKAYQFDDD